MNAPDCAVQRLKLETIRIKPAQVPRNLATRRFKLAAERRRVQTSCTGLYRFAASLTRRDTNLG
jgi:hypothetical protein